MPIYEYTCQDCNTQFEKFVRSMAAEIEIACPHCSGTHVKKGWSLFGMAGAGGSLGGQDAGGAFPVAGSCDTGGT